MKKYITACGIAESDEYPFNISQIRYLLHKRSENGLDLACRKIGKNLYIKTELFEAWLDNHAEAAQHETTK